MADIYLKIDDMKIKLKKSEIKNIIKGCINEALKYDKTRKQYFPDYTDNAHSNAGKFKHNYEDDFNYTRNDYKWSNEKNQSRFNKLQFQNDTEVDPFDPDKEHEDDAYLYLKQHKGEEIVEKAVEQTRDEFYELMSSFTNKITEHYPILKNKYYMSEFLNGIKNALDDFSYAYFN